MQRKGFFQHFSVQRGIFPKKKHQNDEKKMMMKEVDEEKVEDRVAMKVEEKDVHRKQLVEEKHENNQEITYDKETRRKDDALEEKVGQKMINEAFLEYGDDGKLAINYKRNKSKVETGHAAPERENKRIKSTSRKINEKLYEGNLEKEPVCGTPGQHVLPGGKMDPFIRSERGDFWASLQQFQEESGVGEKTLRGLNYREIGCYYPEKRRRRDGGERTPFCVHFIQVDDVDVLAEIGNNTLQRAHDIVHDMSLMDGKKEQLLRSLYATTGLNDDATALYEVFRDRDALSKLETTIEFELSYQAEWADLVREHGLFFSASGGVENKIERVLCNPGENRDWFCDAMHSFLKSCKNYDY